MPGQFRTTILRYEDLPELSPIELRCFGPCFNIQFNYFVLRTTAEKINFALKLQIPVRTPLLNRALKTDSFPAAEQSILLCMSLHLEQLE